MNFHQHWFQKLAPVTFAPIIFYANSVNAQISPDVTLPNNSSVRSQDNIKIIEGGTQAGGNLFHSFEQFSIPTNTTAYFNNSANIQNIITRITGKSISNIDGTLRANSIANLFLINPNGIIFGENGALDIGGSFLATTASSINFADGTKFSAIQPQTAPLLTVSVPIGLQFGATPAPIRNQSQASVDGATNFFRQPVGLRVPTGKTLALIGGDVTFEGGNLTAESGRIELGSVAGNSFVSINSINQGWVLGYEGVENFQNIQLIQRNIDDSQIASIVDVSGKDGGGSINVQGNLVEFIGSFLNTSTRSVTDAGDLTINSRKLIVRDGSQLITTTFGKGKAGNLAVNASDSVELFGENIFQTLLFSGTVGDGNGGNITINTSRLLIFGGAGLSVETSGGTDSNSQFILATGKGGNLTINASEFVELAGTSPNYDTEQLVSRTLNSGDAGKLTISTKRLIVRDGAVISLSSQSPKLPTNFTVVGNTGSLGNAGELNITADSILLDNQGKIVSETDSANGGNINLQLRDLLLMRRNSQISTTAGKAQLEGNGGNITINIPDGFIVAIPKENSDITANAFVGNGGRVEINATGILGIKPRSRDELAQLLSTNNPGELNPQSIPTSDITAISQVNPNLNGKLNINALDVEPDRGITQLLDIPLDTQIAQVCKPSRSGNQSEFIYIRGGVPPLPGEALRSDSPLEVDWISLGGDGERGRKISIHQNQIIQNLKSQIQTPTVEATGWIVDKNGDIVLTALKANGNDQLLGVGGSDATGNHLRWRSLSGGEWYRTSKAPTLPCDATIKNKPG